MPGKYQYAAEKLLKTRLSAVYKGFWWEALDELTDQGVEDEKKAHRMALKRLKDEFPSSWQRAQVEVLSGND